MAMFTVKKILPPPITLLHQAGAVLGVLPPSVAVSKMAAKQRGEGKRVIEEVGFCTL